MPPYPTDRTKFKTNSANATQKNDDKYEKKKLNLKELEKLTTVQNFDKYVEKVCKNTYKQKSPLSPQHPRHGLICAQTAGGKSNLLLNLIFNHYCFHKIWIFCKEPSEDKYQFLEKMFTDIVDKKNEANEEKAAKAQAKGKTPPPKMKVSDIFEMNTSFNNFDIKRDLNAEKQNIVVLDDMCGDKKYEATIRNLFQFSRKLNTSCIYLAQDYTHTDTFVRRNCHYFYLFDCNVKDQQNLAAHHASDIHPHLFKKLLAHCHSQPFGFLMIDSIGPKALKYRNKFIPMTIKDSGL